MEATTRDDRITQGGTGGFFAPPTHPTHTMHIETDLRRRPENRGAMALDYNAEWLSDETKRQAKEILDMWQPLPIDSPEVVAWRRQVLGYFRNCYRSLSPDDAENGVEWHVGKLRVELNAGKLEVITKNDSDATSVDDHAGVHYIRKFYPGFVPTEDDWRNARWGS